MMITPVVVGCYTCFDMLFSDACMLCDVEAKKSLILTHRNILKYVGWVRSSMTDVHAYSHMFMNHWEIF